MRSKIEMRNRNFATETFQSLSFNSSVVSLLSDERINNNLVNNWLKIQNFVLYFFIFVLREREFFIPKFYPKSHGYRLFYDNHVA